MEIKKIGIVGAGLMGTGIAQVAIQTGFKVILNDVSSELVDRSMGEIKKRIDRSVEKGQIDEIEAGRIIGNLSCTSNNNDLQNVDFLIEAVNEDLDLKKKVFRELDGICNKETIFASNTSCFLITEIAGDLKRSEKIIGMHFFYPAPLMKLIEIIPGLMTSKETVEAAKSVAEKLGKTYVLAKDTPGFIVNRLMIPLQNEAISLINEGVDPKDIDTAVKLGLNWPMGIIELIDFVSLDGLLKSTEALYHGFQDEKYKPHMLLKKMVIAGKFGKKNKEGFYKYDK
jgi:3-hydroxybutyryl-CoA dehydrogenase